MSKSYKKVNEELGDMKDFDVEKAYEELPRLQRAFVDAYYGNARRACELCGMSYRYAQRLMMRNDIRAILRSRIRTSPAHQSMIATREERQMFWTRTMTDPACSRVERLKASELLGKSYCDFSEKKIIEGGVNPVQHRLSVSVEDRIKQLKNEVSKPQLETSDDDDELDFI